MLPWFLAAALVILPVALAKFADDEPRNDEPPDTGEDGKPAVLPLAA